MATVKKIKIVDSQGVDVSYDIGALAQNIVYDNNNSVKDKIDDYEDIIPSSASSSNQLLTEEDLPVATDEQVGLVKPDGTTITIDENGTLTAIGGGGGSYTAGSGISISNSVITNIRKGALTGVIDSVSSNIAHTQITGARDTFAAGALILLQSEAAGTADNLRIQYGAQPSDSQTFAIYDTSGTAASVTIASGDTVIMMIDNTGYRAIILNVLSASGGSSYAGLGIGKKKTVTNNVIDTDIDLHRAPIVGDRLLVYFDETVQNPTGLKTYNNGVAVTSNLENATPLYLNAGWNILEFKNDGFLYNNCQVRVQNVPIPNNALSGLSDTTIVSPSDGQMLAYDNSSSKWKNKTIAANNSGTPVRELKTLQIGDAVFDAFGLKTFDVTSVTSGVSGAIAVDVITASQLNGEIIAIHTGSNTGSTGNAWTLALSDSQTVEALTMSKADGTAFTDALTANSLMFVKVNTSNDTAVVLGIVGASGGGVAESVVGTVESGTTASQAYAVGEHFIRNDKFCTAIASIASGATLTLNTNYVEGTIADNLTSVETDVDYIGVNGSTMSAETANCMPPRFKDISNDFFNGSLRSEIAAGNFKNVRPGDYITYSSSGKNFKFVVCDCDYWYNKGDTNCTTHHLRVMLTECTGITELWAGLPYDGGTGHWSGVLRCPWNAATDVDPTSASAVGSNSTNITRNGASAYAGSFVRDRLVTRILPEVFNLAFGSSNVLKVRNLLSNAVDTSKPSGGSSAWNGIASGWGWFDSYLELPSEIELYGSTVFSSSGFDTGCQDKQLAIFKNASLDTVLSRNDVWTKAVVSSSRAATRGIYGVAGSDNASRANWAFPLGNIK